MEKRGKNVIAEFLPLKVYTFTNELQIRGGFEDNSKTIFLMSQKKNIPYVVTPH